MHSSQQERLFSENVNDICRLLGLNWIAVDQLTKAHLLSFQPEPDTELTEQQVRELIFLGQMVANGCDIRMLKLLLQSLQAPFAYSHSHIYFDWQQNIWLPKPDIREPSEIAYEHIESLIESGDMSELTDFKACIDDALEQMSQPS